MTKTIKTLKEDIEHVLKTGEGWTKEISEFVAEDIQKSLNRQFNYKNAPESKTLRMSSLGTPCERKLWYTVNAPFAPESFTPSTSLKFLFGDLTESLILGLVKASGHNLTGMQDAVSIQGVVGHRDCIIDGMVFDVKSASSYGFKKFKDHTLEGDDTFGYISQLSSYLYASSDDPLVSEKTKAGFLAFDKSSGDIAVDIYDMTEYLKGKEDEVRSKRRLVTEENPPERPFKPVPHGKSGNMKIPMHCSYCQMKHGCWGNLRTFLYSGGPVYMTHVEKEPEVFELK